MKFGFDIDDTLIDLRAHAFSLYNKKLGKNVSFETFQAIQRVEIHEPFGLTDEEGSAMWNSVLEEIYFTDCPSFEGALKTLQTLAEQGHDIYYITSRPKQYCAQTKAWMEAQGFPITDGHFFCGMQDAEKVAIIKELALDIYVDDKPAVLETLHDVTTKVILKNQSYNQHVNLPRLDDWQEFQMMLIK
ncbi:MULTISPECIES: 5' nucleotidase, NT5C type [Lysinibacillus]|uniref:Nucleotidase n=1 Tax=Lysinibacillus boronitolerans JCM 21713 = 10a = NBRC 103108 TaxID=1294264 RepID=A0ABR4XUE0_9BACI|nr:HAD family acid phosphatase [Lysinibacillus boronitolerans]KGR81205.1 nucleotidase [Lysinibacillus boronitolerans JCM 21713 = 10a = NBRC 103108]